MATSRFHHPAHAAEWADPDIDAAFDDIRPRIEEALAMVDEAMRIDPLRRQARGNNSIGRQP